MSWFSILPESLIFIETWAIRTFLLLGVLVLGPWLLLLVYDAVLYVLRLATYEIPYIGGRARNRPRPRAPSLSERPNGKGRPRIMSMPSNTAVDIAEAVEVAAGGMKRRPESSNHKRNGSAAIVDD
ncbi:hypothetical protein CJF32_00007599 [Rutstroemia sp. NJR-2017a WRK4]|nr:hypothetical protein CJF32_00007599 [Rutstroemia sp. NJR-2017a WRK4]PQE25571.1 hypothetical protein CJF30_00000265 [Rutstroemia sp. NJR-2017a BBW]